VSPTKEASSVRRAFPHLLVENFGPLRHCSLDVKDFLVFIGEQSSGKSTIAKLIYFFRSVPDLLDEHMPRLVAEGNPWENVVKLLRQSLMSYFGTTKHMDDFELVYQYNSHVSLRVTKEKKSGHARIEPSPRLRGGLRHIMAEMATLHEETREIRDPFRRTEMSVQQSRDLTQDRRLRQLFGQENHLVFIPAGRSFLSTLSGELLNVDSYHLDPLMRSFVSQILALRRNFSRTMDEQMDLALRASLRDAPVRQEHVKSAMQIIRSILKGEYSYQQGQERIHFSKDRYVYLKFASSGQQESLWILLSLFSVVMNNTPVFVIIEEPEAHLFPRAQKEMVDLIALCKNFTPEPPVKNGLVLTTHSPYILSAINNLLYAWQIGSRDRSCREKVKTVVDPRLWLNPQEVGAWYVEDGKIRSILDPELRLIRAEEIDGASSLINQTFDALAEVQAS